MFSDGSILMVCQLVSHFLATNAIKIPHSDLPKSSEKALLGYQINTFNLLQSIALVLKEKGHGTSTKSKMKLLFFMTRILWLFGILAWNVTTVSCYCSIKKKIQADKWPLLSLNLRKCVDQGRWYIYIIRIWKILFISSPWRKQDFRKKKATRLHTL